MATIGSFTAGKDGYTGTIRTLTMNVKARIVANDRKSSDGAPDFRIFAGRAELGAAWKAKTNGEEPRDYLSVQLDDPSSLSRSAPPCSRRRGRLTSSGTAGIASQNSRQLGKGA